LATPPRALHYRRTPQVDQDPPGCRRVDEAPWPFVR